MEMRACFLIPSLTNFSINIKIERQVCHCRWEFRTMFQNLRLGRHVTLVLMLTLLPALSFPGMVIMTLLEIDVSLWEEHMTHTFLCGDNGRTQHAALAFVYWGRLNGTLGPSAPRWSPSSCWMACWVGCLGADHEPWTLQGSTCLLT